MTHPGRYVTQAVVLYLQAGSYSFLPSQRGSTAQVPLLQVPSSPRHRKRVLMGYPYNDPLFCSSQTVPLLVTLKKGKTPLIKQFLSPAPKEHHTKRHWGKEFCQANTSWPKHIKSFLLKFPFISHLNAFFFPEPQYHETKHITTYTPNSNSTT